MKIETLLKRHEEVFQGIGKIFAKKKNEEFLVKFSMKPDATPVAQKPRPVPYYLQEPLRNWLDECIKEEIFEKVESGEPVTWCSPLVVQPKPRYSSVSKDSLQPHMIRASVDLRVPNKHMERSRILQSPVVEDFTCKFHDCKVFSKLDLRQGYHQLILHPDSRAIATFSTPWGNFRPKRLIFGAKSSQDLFDEAMFRIFGDIPKCLNQRDDILIGGCNLTEHNKTLETVLQRARDFGVTFNREKCRFGVCELEFYGYKFSSEGLKPTEDKVKAVKNCKPPASKEEVKSFLGMIGYLSKFIPRYAVLTAPLRRLTGQDVPFSWGPDEDQAFMNLKASITCDNTMAFFDPKKPIVVRTEASFHEGLSAGLFQKTSKGLQPVHFISRSMTTAEKRYSQTEKDALAVKWAKSRFGMYLLGAPRFKIITSHKPLIPMFNKSCSKLPPRIEKWIMEMQDVDYELVYEPGKDEADPMDYLSRYPLPDTEEDNTEKAIKALVTNEHGVVMRSIREATSKDVVLQDIVTRMKQNDWDRHKNRPEIKPYYMIRHELSRAKGLLLRDKQIVIPEELQRQVITAAHSLGHFGITITKQMLRAKYWFPRLNSMVEDAISRCFQCQLTTVEHKQEPIKPSEIPDSAWHTVSVDYGGPYPDGHYNLVVIDKRTRFPAVEQTTSTSCRVTCDRLRKIFATHGIPERVESDNGPPFNSAEFKGFATEMGFRHHRVTPEHPRANGEAESFMKVLNKTEQIAHNEGRSSSTAIQNMLMGYRSTPHPATGYSPYEALMRRNVKTKLDYQPLAEKPNIQNMEAEITKRDTEYKKRWGKQHRHPACQEHSFKVGDKVLLKRKKVNKWSTAHEKDHYVIVGLNGSAIKARRESDGRTVTRDAAKFKILKEPQGACWRERLLRSSDRRRPETNTGDEEVTRERNIDGNDRTRLTDQQDEDQQHDNTRRGLQPQPPPRRELPKRNKRPPPRFRDYKL
ncbi:MAG: RNase H-like domain-containing protein, partial [Candidatus Thiodiazotropha sp.]